MASFPRNEKGRIFSPEQRAQQVAHAFEVPAYELVREKPWFREYKGNIHPKGAPSNGVASLCLESLIKKKWLPQLLFNTRWVNLMESCRY